MTSKEVVCLEKTCIEMVPQGFYILFVLQVSKWDSNSSCKGKENKQKQQQKPPQNNSNNSFINF